MKESRPTGFEEKWRFCRYRTTTGVVSDFFEEKWKRVTVRLTVCEERWAIGWYLTRMEVMSDDLDPVMDILVTCVRVVRWMVGWK